MGTKALIFLKDEEIAEGVRNFHCLLVSPKSVYLGAFFVIGSQCGLGPGLLLKKSFLLITRLSFSLNLQAKWVSRTGL